jgi:hypothetical protein
MNKFRNSWRTEEIVLIPTRSRQSSQRMGADMDHPQPHKARTRLLTAGRFLQSITAPPPISAFA